MEYTFKRTDVVLIKKLNKEGLVIGKARFIGSDKEYYIICTDDEKCSLFLVEPCDIIYIDDIENRLVEELSDNKLIS